MLPKTSNHQNLLLSEGQVWNKGCLREEEGVFKRGGVPKTEYHFCCVYLPLTPKDILGQVGRVMLHFTAS